MKEQESAPALGGPTKPSAVGTSGGAQSDVMARELDMAPNDLEAAIQSGSITLWSPVMQKDLAAPMPVQATVKERDDGNYDVTLLYSQINPLNFVHRYDQGETPLYYQTRQDNDRGKEMEDRTIVMTKKDLWQAWNAALQMGGGGAPGGMPGMGGGPMGGAPGGMPPMGGM